MERRPLGATELEVSPVAMGCWPIAGMTSPGTSEASSIATLRAAFAAGINFFDTAFAYGRDGESERLIRRALGAVRAQIIVATKVGIAWDNEGKQVVDGRPATLRRQLETSLARLGGNFVDVLYLHAPDRTLALEESAGALARLLAEGKTRAVGLSNATGAELERFAAACPLAVFQPHYNMLQREIEGRQLPWCRARNVAVAVYWPLLKGLLAGRMTRADALDPRDGRRKYPMFQGEEWEKNLAFVEELRTIARGLGRSVAELVVNWTIHQPGITAALCGAKRPEQIEECARAMGWRLPAEILEWIAAAQARRGAPASVAAVN